jgi:hypothetical protein
VCGTSVRRATQPVSDSGVAPVGQVAKHKGPVPIRQTPSRHVIERHLLGLQGSNSRAGCLASLSSDARQACSVSIARTLGTVGCCSVAVGLAVFGCGPDLQQAALMMRFCCCLASLSLDAGQTCSGARIAPWGGGGTGWVVVSLPVWHRCLQTRVRLATKVLFETYGLHCRLASLSSDAGQAALPHCLRGWGVVSSLASLSSDAGPACNTVFNSKLKACVAVWPPHRQMRARPAIHCHGNDMLSIVIWLRCRRSRATLHPCNRMPPPCNEVVGTKTLGGCRWEGFRSK